MDVKKMGLNVLPTHKARKRFGQNFLNDPLIIDRIISAINPTTKDHMVEIGPGQGALTESLLSAVDILHVIELDRDLVEYLKVKFASNANLIIHNGDAQKFDFHSITKKDEKIRLVGNLPYNISTPLIFHILKYTSAIRDMYFMLQKEVVSRMCANPGEKNYGRLSVMTQYFCTAFNVLHVAPESFSPQPKVDSAIIKMVPHEKKPFICNDYELFQTIVREAFIMRRKTLSNSLKKMISSDELKKLDINPQLRAENLSLESYVLIANYLSTRSV